MRLARDDVVGAADDSDRALELTGGDWEVEPPFYEAIVGAQVALAQGRRTDALALVERMIAASGKPLTIRGTDVTEFALLLRDLDLPRDAIVEEAESRPAAPWLQVAACVARDELERAADGLAALRTPPLEAAVRLCAAKNLVAEGRGAEVDEQLQKALAFYRSVGATRYIREGEALLAAAS